MGKRKRMIDTSVPEHEEEVGPSRSRLRQERKALKARLEGLGQRLAGLPDDKRDALALDPLLEREVLLLSRMRPRGGGLTRQRRRVAALLRELDEEALEDLEARVERALGG